MAFLHSFAARTFSILHYDLNVKLRLAYTPATSRQMKLGLVIASHGRAEILQQVLVDLVSQRRIPDDIVISVVRAMDIPQISPGLANVRTIFGGVGLAR